MAVNGDGTESEEFLVRKLHVFNRIIGLLYGPVTGRYTATNKVTEITNYYYFLG